MESIDALATEARDYLFDVLSNPELQDERGYVSYDDIDLGGAAGEVLQLEIRALSHSGEIVRQNGSLKLAKARLEPVAVPAQNGNSTTPARKRFLEEKVIDTLLELKPTPAHFKVLISALKFVDWGTGKTFVTKTGLADRSGCTRKTVAAAFRWAEEVGVIGGKTEKGDRYEYTFAPTLLSDHLDG